MRRRSRSSRAFLLGPVLCLAALLTAQASAGGKAPRHFGLSDLDRALTCIERLQGRLVLRHSGLDNRLRIDPCPTDRAQLEGVLARQGLRLFDAGDFGFLISSKFLPPWPPDLSPFWPRMKWSRVRATLKVRPAEGLPEAQAQAIASRILREARTIPLYTPEEPQTDGAVSIEVKLGFHVTRLRPGAPPTVLALLDQLPDSTAGRLVYGEMRNGKYELLWDSPLFNANGGISFEDVDGDGWQEIVIESLRGGNHVYPGLVIFDRAGRELTRQSKCETLNEGFDEVDGVCAILGADISLSTNEQGPKQIRVTNWSGDGKDHLFQLKDGRYVPGPPLASSGAALRPSLKATP